MKILIGEKEALKIREEWTKITNFPKVLSYGLWVSGSVKSLRFVVLTNLILPSRVKDGVQ